MAGVDRRTREAAWRAAWLARQAAEQSRRAAELAAKAAEAAALGEGLVADPPKAVAELRAGAAAMRRQNAACQRTADRMLSNFSRRLRRWAADAEAGRRARPVLMREAAEFAGWGGVVLTLPDGSGGELLVAASDQRVRRVHELEVALGEGPTMDAYQGRGSLAQGDELARRWPRFAGMAERLGVHAVGAVPLDLAGGAARGSLAAVGPPLPALPGEGRRRLQQVAHALDQGILATSRRVNPAGTDLPGLSLFEGEDFQVALHQAAGVLHERHGWGLHDAIALIEAHAFAEDRIVADVAEDILAERLWTA